MSTGTNSGPTFDYYKNAESWISYNTTTLANLIESVRSTEFAETVSQIRALDDAGEHDKANALKKQLPAVSLSGYCKGKRRDAVKQNRFTPSGLIQLDFDAKDNPGWSVDEIVGILKADSRTVAVFKSASGKGVKGIARCLPDVDKHLACFLAAEAHYKSLMLTIDPACKDHIRLCFVSHDPDAWLRLDAPDQFEPEPDEEPLPAVNGHKHLTRHGAGEDDTLTPDLIAEMLAVIPYPGYDEWLKLFNAVRAEVGVDEAIRLCNAVWPEKHEGDYQKHAAYPTDRITRGTLIWHATNNGWKPSRALKAEQRANGKDKRVAELTKAEPTKKLTAYNPEEVFYDSANGRYWVKVGKSYHCVSKRPVVQNGIIRFLSPQYVKAKDLAAAALSALDARELDGGVQWAGTIAGHALGPTLDADGIPIIIVREAHQPLPGAGECPLLASILDQAFPKLTAFQVFLSWAATRYKAVRGHMHIPAPMLVLAGEINSGKSLLGWIIGEVLGGRTCNPYASWSGAILWNDDMIGAELLLVDDCMGHTDIKSRRMFGAAFKEAIYSPIVQLRKRNVSSIAVRPSWCVVVCCNDTPESLQIIPPLDPDMEDKIILLKVEHVTLPWDASTPEGKARLQAAIRAELSAFARYLAEWETPELLVDSRSGIKAWRDPVLAEALDEHSPPRRLEELLELAIKDRGIWHDLPCELTSTEIEARLKDVRSPVREQARSLLGWHGACGSNLAKLVKLGSEIVSLGAYNDHLKRARYWVKAAVSSCFENTADTAQDTAKDD